jgi:hypothetical protein
VTDRRAHHRGHRHLGGDARALARRDDVPALQEVVDLLYLRPIRHLSSEDWVTPFPQRNFERVQGEVSPRAGAGAARAAPGPG